MEERAKQRASSARSDHYDDLQPLNSSPSIPSLVITTSTPTVVLPSSPSTVSSALSRPLVEAYPQSLTGSPTHASSPPSNWVAHDPASPEKASVIASAPAEAFTAFASFPHYSSAEATPNFYPMTYPPPAALTTTSGAAVHDAVTLEKLDAHLIPDHCGPSSKGTLRYVSTTFPTALTPTPEAGSAPSPSNGPDSPFPVALRRFFHRSSALKSGKNLDNGTGMVLAEDSECDTSAVVRMSSQRNLHSGHSCSSGGAGSPHSPSPVASSTPAVAVEMAPLASVTPRFEEALNQPPAMSWSCATTTKGKCSGHTTHVAATPVPQTQPRHPHCVSMQEDCLNTRSQRQESHISPPSTAQACPSAHSGAATVSGQSSLCSPVLPLSKRFVHQRGSGIVLAGRTTPFVAVNHFSSAAEMQGDPHDANASHDRIFLNIGSGMDNEEFVAGDSLESQRSARSGVVTVLKAAASEAATSFHSASDTASPPALSGTADAAAPPEATVSTKASDSCISTQSIDVTVGARHSPMAGECISGDVCAETSTAEITVKTEERFPRSRRSSPRLFSVASPNLGGLPKAAVTHASSSPTPVHPSMAKSGAANDTHESRSQQVRASSQPMAPSCLLDAHSTATSFPTPTEGTQHCHTNEDVRRSSHSRNGREQHDVSHRRTAHLPPPPQPPPPRILSPMLRTGEQTPCGFSTLAPSAYEPPSVLGCDASPHFGVSPYGSCCASPEQDDAPLRVHYTASSLSSSPASTGTAMDVDDRSITGGRSTVFPNFGSFSLSTNITNTPRLSVDDSASRVSSPSLVSSLNRKSFVDLAHKSSQDHQSHSYLQSDRSAGTVIHTVPACARESPTSEVGVVHTTVAPQRSLANSGESETCLSGSVSSSGQRRSSSSGVGKSCGCMQIQTDDDEQNLAAPASATPPHDGASTVATSSVASLAATVTSIVSQPIKALFAGNLTAPVNRKGNDSAYQLWPPGSLTGQSTSCSKDSFVMHSDAETLRGLMQGKFPRMPGCSIRDWGAHLCAKEAELRRQEKHRHTPPTPASTAASRTSRLPRMTPQEVSTHNTADDLWIVIRNVVYDCTVFQRFHPGGEKLLLACGGHDATAVYERFHAWVSCESFMAPYAVGVLAPPETR
ncbi:hypothetical protein, conserved [Leishmania tarentolae]|uniref:Cytochrome b5 heme-binding domain-containing protein n=1 Tax=Leishmania tarentolae TaxID=5689 RepID=A0A640KIF0_LEITA|nr:hypothetical protein, conserved [Leishmania tarentolae]